MELQYRYMSVTYNVSCNLGTDSRALGLKGLAAREAAPRDRSTRARSMSTDGGC